MVVLVHTFIEDVHLTDVCFVKADSIPIVLHSYSKFFIMSTEFDKNISD